MKVLLLIILTLLLLPLFLFATLQDTYAQGYCVGYSCAAGPPTANQRQCTSDADCGNSCNPGFIPVNPTGNRCECRPDPAQAGTCGARIHNCRPGFQERITGTGLAQRCECVQSATASPGSCTVIGGIPFPGSSVINCNPASGGTGISTGVGCIPISTTEDFVAWFLGWAIGISGGIAFLLIVISGFQMMTATGDPQKLQGAREMLTAAVSGLILIIFSVFLLNLIGVQILRIPGF